MGGTHHVEADSPATHDNIGLLHQINEHLDLQGKMAAIQQYASDHPITTLFLMVTIVMCSVPFFCFLAFVFAATIFGFTGFVIYEGVVLMLSSLVLGGALFLMGLLSLGFSSFIVLAYFTFKFSMDMVNKVSTRFPLPEFLVTRLPDCTTTNKDM